MARFRWPFRRKTDPPSTAPVETAISADAPQRADSLPNVEQVAAPVEGRGLAIDSGFAGGFRSRAERSSGTGLLGPWGGLGGTARFVVEASRLPATLATQRRIDRLADAPGMIDQPENFARQLPSLASYADPFGALDESGQAFAESLPVAAGTETFREPASQERPVQQGVRRSAATAPRGTPPAAETVVRPGPVVARRAAPSTTAQATSTGSAAVARASRGPDTPTATEQRAFAAGDATEPIASEVEFGVASPAPELPQSGADVQSRVAAAMAMPLIVARRIDGGAGRGATPGQPIRTTGPTGDVRPRALTGNTAHSADIPPGVTRDSSAVESRSGQEGGHAGDPPVAERPPEPEASILITSGAEVAPTEHAPAPGLPLARLVSDVEPQSPIPAESSTPGPGDSVPAPAGPPLSRPGPARRFTIGEPIEGTGPFAGITEGRVGRPSRRAEPRGDGAELPLAREPRGAASRMSTEGGSDSASPGTPVLADGVPLVVGRRVDATQVEDEFELAAMATGAQPPAELPGMAVESTGQAAEPSSHDLPLVAKGERGVGSATGEGSEAAAAGQDIARTWDSASPPSHVASTPGAPAARVATAATGGRGSVEFPLFGNAVPEPIHEATPVATAGEAPIARRTADAVPMPGGGETGAPGVSREAEVARLPGAGVFGPAASLPLATRAGIGPGEALPGSTPGIATFEPAPGTGSPGAFGSISAAPLSVARRVETQTAHTVARADAAVESTGTESGLSSEAAGDGNGGGPPQEADLESLTEKVWQRIRSRLMLERERRRGLP